MTLGLANRTAVHPAPLVEVTVSAAAFCFDGQHLCLLVRKSALEGAELPNTSFGAGSTVAKCSSAVLEGVGVRRYVQIHQVGAFERAGPSPSGLPGDLDILTLAICKPQTRLEVLEAAPEAFAWVPLPQVQGLGPNLRRRCDAAVQALRNKARFDSVAFDFLGDEFSLSELQRVFEAVLGRTIDVRNFRKKIEALDLLVESPNKPRGMAYRPPRLFRFDSAKFEKRIGDDGEIRFF